METLHMINAWLSFVMFLVLGWTACSREIKTGIWYTLGLSIMAGGSVLSWTAWLDGSSVGDIDKIIWSQALESFGLAICIIRFIASPKRHTMSRISALVDTALHIGDEQGVTERQFRRLEKKARMVIK